jgi:hypothetical protein
MLDHGISRRAGTETGPYTMLDHGISGSHADVVLVILPCHYAPFGAIWYFVHDYNAQQRMKRGMIVVKS